MSLKDYAISIEVLTKIYDRLNEIFINYGPASDGLKEIQSKVYNRVKVKEYQDIVEEYYPIETIVYGIKNNKQDFIDKGRNLICSSH